MGLRGQQLEDIRRKEDLKNIFSTFERSPVEKKVPRTRQLKKALVNSKIYTKQNLKEGLHLKSVGTWQD